MDEREPGERQTHDTVALELESMRQIAHVLDSLHDADARRRVVQWAHDRYCAHVALQPSTVIGGSADPALGVEELGDLFDAATSSDREAETAAKPRTGVESMIKDFAADFRRFALEWQGA